MLTKAEIKKRAAAYPKVVVWSDDDDCFIGRCPLLFEGGVHGDDEARVYRQLCRVAEEWVATLDRDGAPLPKTRPASDYSGRFVVRVDPTLHQRLALKALATGDSLNGLVTRALLKA